MTDKTERQRLWKRVTAAASVAGSTLDVCEERIIMSTLCYIVYDLVTDKIKTYKLELPSEAGTDTSVGSSVGAGVGLEMQLSESDISVYRYGGFALHAMLKKSK